MKPPQPWMAVVAVVAAMLPAVSYAWGPEGHAMVADIAEMHLDARAKAEVMRLLALDDDVAKKHLDEVSSWADAVRSARPETGPNHYVDIPLAAAGYDEARDCHQGSEGRRAVVATCVVAKLPYYVHVLADRSRSDHERLEALKWVVHFAGDLHQPLHAEDHDDKGGNGLALTYAGTTTNLHAVWDLGIIEQHYGMHLGWNYSFDHDAVRAKATELDAQIASDQRASWAPSDLDAHIEAAVAGWANESHLLAQAAYAKLPTDKAPGWDRVYQDYAWPVVRSQLQKAGVRLAAVLNQALD